MSIKTKLVSAAKKTGEFMDKHHTAIFEVSTVVTLGTLVYITNALIDNGSALKKRVSNLEIVTLDHLEHPRAAIQEADGSFTVTRLERKPKNDTTS